MALFDFPKSENKMKVVLSSQVYLSMLSETYSFPKIETGGIFLGTIKDNVWYVIENIDPGYDKIVRHSAYFEYDVNYVNHVANVKNKLYLKELVLLGLWHRHPGSMDTFSGTDKETNNTFSEQLPEGAISALVNIDPNFRITMYYISKKYVCSKIKYEVGDSKIPQELLARKTPEYYINSINNKNEQDELLQVFEYEYEEYLNKQTKYEYEMQMGSHNIELNMKYIGTPNRYCPQSIKVIFFIDHDKPSVKINQETYLYHEMIIEEYIKKMTYCAFLGIEDGKINSKIIKQQYREKIRETHPDKNSHQKNPQEIVNAEERTKKLNNVRDWLLEYLDKRGN
jgi:hypothetical protein